MLWRCWLLVLVAAKLTYGLYEDQVGLFDWQKHLTGAPRHILNAPGSQKVIFGTDRTVLAAVDVNTGELAWRRILEAGDAELNNEKYYPGIDAMWLNGHGGRSVAVLTFGGRALRLFDVENGKMKSEFSLVSEKSDAVFSSSAKKACSRNKALHVVADAAENEVVIADGNGVISKLSLLPASAQEKTPIRWRYEAHALQYRPIYLARNSPTSVVALLTRSTCGSSAEKDGSRSAAMMKPLQIPPMLVELAADSGAVMQSVKLDSSMNFDDSACELIHDGSSSKQTLLLCVSRLSGEVILLETSTGKSISVGKNIDAIFGTKCGYEEKTISATSRARIAKHADARKLLQCLGDDCRDIVFTCPNERPGTYVLRLNIAAHGSIKYEAVALDSKATAMFVASRLSTIRSDNVAAADDILLTASAIDDSTILNSRPISEVTLAVSKSAAAVEPKPFVSLAASYGAPRNIYAWQTVKLGVKQLYYVIVTQLDVVLLLRGDELLWARHEGLASIVSAAITELPQTASEELIENEFVSDADVLSSGSASGAQLPVSPSKVRLNAAWMPQSIAHAFGRRLYTQCLQLKHFVFHFQDHITSLLSTQILPGGGVGGGDNRPALVSKVPNFKVLPKNMIASSKQQQKDNKLMQRNQFDTHKLIIAATRSGALYGLETRHGNIVWFSAEIDQKLSCIPNERTSWQRTVPDCKFHLFIQRINAPKPYSASHVAIIIGEADAGSSAVGAWQQFNPVTGKFTTPQAQLLPAAVSSAGLLPLLLDAEHLQPAFVLDAAFGVHILPPTKLITSLLADSSSYVSRFIRNDLFLSTIQQSSPRSPVLAVGCKPQIDVTSSSIQCLPTWSHELISVDDDDAHRSRIVTVAAKSAQEVAYSDARIIADEQLLYKYINPNLLLIITETSESAASAANGDSATQQSSSKSSLGSGASSGSAGTTLHVLCVDMITGHVILNNVHKRASSPVAAVVSENFVVYTYWSERMRNTEVAVFDFYLGERKLVGTRDGYERAFSSAKDLASLDDADDDDAAAASDKNSEDDSVIQERNSTIPFLSSSASPWLSSFVLADYTPMIEQRVYNLRAPVRALAVSQTARGIAHKSLYFALSNGAVLELPKLVVDARRPVILDAKAREEGLAPYTPELPLAVQQYVNYNRSAMQIAQLHCAPAGLESTALLFVSGGLDLFFTQLAPSQRFDVLKDDFDYYMLILALVALVAASLISRRMAHRKVLMEVWK